MCILYIYIYINKYWPIWATMILDANTCTASYKPVIHVYTDVYNLTNQLFTFTHIYKCFNYCKYLFKVDTQSYFFIYGGNKKKKVLYFAFR